MLLISWWLPDDAQRLHTVNNCKMFQVFVISETGQIRRRWHIVAFSTTDRRQLMTATSYLQPITCISRARHLATNLSVLSNQHQLEFMTIEFRIRRSSLADQQMYRPSDKRAEMYAGRGLSLLRPVRRIASEWVVDGKSSKSTERE